MHHPNRSRRRLRSPSRSHPGVLAAASTLALAILAVAGCGDDPMAPEEEHVDPEGFAIEVEGVEVVRYLDAQGGSPALTFQNGTTYEVAVVFLDAAGNPLEHEEHEEGEEEEHTLRWDITDGSLLTWTPEDHDHEEGEEEHEHLEFHGEVTTLDTGSTTVTLCVEHEDHCDYESSFVTVTIN